MSSQLTEATSESVDELFAKDPVELTDEDLDRICEKLEASCAAWQGKQDKSAPATVDVKSILDDLPEE